MSSLVNYYSGDSILHNLDPRVKLVMLVLITILIFMVKNFIVIGILFASLIFMWFIADLPFHLISSYFKFMMGLFVILIIMQAIFYSGSTILIEPLIPEFVPLIGGVGNIALEGILFGLLVCLRVLTLISFLPLVTFTTPVEKLALSMIKMGLPYEIAFTATTALNQIPVLQSEVQSIMNAQQLRGFTVFETGNLWQKLKAYPALVVPLVMGAMRRSQMMGVAMDSRAFGASAERSYIEDIVMNKKDWMALVFVILYMAVLLYINYFLV